MNRKIIIGISILILFTLGVTFSNSKSEKNAKKFQRVVNTLEESKEVLINDLTEFEWDSAYVFKAYTSKEKIFNTIGFKSQIIEETVSEGMNQLIFVKDKQVVCFLYGYPDNVGYGFNFEDTFSKVEDYIKLNYKDSPIFSTEKIDNIIYFTCLAL
ncbi:hypothetical protein [Clostridium gasigenes]|uniref:Uncharacterized protein n=1 Tax=Clostridium gasigenes TaxID=94869 RepID=A0A7X0SA96_9CLOT|nr:hypothetical protein [Clostridium gasigenes]MBB6713854.1 hypothetical protein [Clostridium gasigenes]MBU3087114.1 hypothetical protein [Clostridium gasigenes]